MRRELVCCLTFSVPLGLWLGPTGILLAFIAGSSGSTLLPLHAAFAKASDRPLWTMLRASWSRAALSAGLAATLSLWGLRYWGGDWRLTVMLAGLCLAATLGVAFGAALIRARRSGYTSRAELARFM